jgi:hypothetical protein
LAARSQETHLFISGPSAKRITDFRAALDFDRFGIAAHR